MSDTKVEVYPSIQRRKGHPPRLTYRWRAKAGNGEIIASGQPYARKWNARRGAARAFPDAEIIDVR